MSLLQFQLVKYCMFSFYFKSSIGAFPKEVATLWTWLQEIDS